jgi:hypothetical protein
VADRVTNADGERWYNEHRVSRVFAAGERRRIRLVGSDRLAVFVDGERAATTGGYPIPVGRAGERLAGRLLLGTGPDAQTPWTGTFFALTLEDGPETLARYAFAQDEGRTVRSHARAGLDLDLPPHFLSLRRPLGHVATGAADVLVNLLGFVPFGYLLAVRLRGRARLLLLVAGAGFALSLAIELAQSLTVARRSSLEDLGLNTLGTWVGAACALHVGRLRRRSDASG